MSKSKRLRLALDGNLAAALKWEAERRGTSAQRLAIEILERSCSPIVVEWEEARASILPLPGQPSAETIRAVQTVLRKAYGPRRRKRRRSGPVGV